jgi:hypothetical protein
VSAMAWPPGPDDLRFLLREHSLVLEPGEVLVVMIPPDWPPWQAKELQDALTAYATDIIGVPVLVVPGTALAVGRQLAVVRDVKPAG